MIRHSISMESEDDFLYNYKKSKNIKILKRLLPNYKEEDEVEVYYPKIRVREYYKNGVLHNTTGPAVVSYYPDGKVIENVYYVEGMVFSEEDSYWESIFNKNLNEILEWN